MDQSRAPFKMNCRKCGKLLDGNTSMEKGTRPRHGDVSLCIYCGALSIFDMNKQRLRPPTQWEQAELSKNPDVARALAAITIAKAKQGYKSQK
ncbi:hypothetical protein [Paraburkholderia youngii]|uniref:hypothetical protein n=1 Tax=Paraburkholderia youngii TaxID=2782701 RepID=UPI00159058EE|nr:hypothetical protein [Paraburkholderia youngii]NUX58714.1 hypothetical protein [Paraburkholderia youngii]